MQGKTNCQACPVGKVMGQKECPGVKLKLRLFEWLKKRLPGR